MTSRAVPVGTRWQGFIDDFLIERRAALTTRLHQFEKHPSPVLTVEAPWESPGRGGLGGPVNALYDADRKQFRLWYAARGFAGAGILPGVRNFACYATSDDGVHFERPELGLVEFDGSTTNNIVAEHRDGAAHLFTHGMLDCPEMQPYEPAERRYKGVTAFGRDSDGQYGHGMVFSHDGIHWTEGESNPVIRGRNHGDSVSLAKVRHTTWRGDEPPAIPSAKYAMFPKIRTQVGEFERRCIGLCLSEATKNPAVNWSVPVLTLTPDARDDDLTEEHLAAARDVLLYDHPDDHRSEFYAMVVHRYGDIFLGFLWIFDVAFECRRIGGSNQHGPLHVQLIASRDLVNWERIGDRKPILDRGEPGSFDAGMIFYHSVPIAVGGEWWIYYAGFDSCHTPGPYVEASIQAQRLREVAEGRRQLPAIGLAKIRQGGFVSLDAREQTGTLVTRPMVAGGAGLEFNARVASAGEIRVEVQDAGGEPLRGFESGACTGVTGDGIALRVHWGDRTGDAAWTGRTLRLAFQITNAELYGFRFTAATEP